MRSSEKRLTLLIFGFLMLLMIDGFSQNQSAILFKNSSVLRCQILSDTAGQYLVMLPDTTFQRLSPKKIYFIKHSAEGISDRDIKKEAYRPRKGVSAGFMLEMMLGTQQVALNNDSFYGVSGVPYVSFFDVFSVGVGSGIRMRLDEVYVVPLYLDMRLSGRTKIAPTAAFKVGRILDPENEFDKIGDMAGLAVGVIVRNFGRGNLQFLVGVNNSPRIPEEPPLGFNAGPAPKKDPDISTFTFSMSMAF